MPIMNPTQSLLSCHTELSNLANQLQNHRNLLINDPYIRHVVESSNTKPLNSFYFPYCSMVEKYIHFADEYHDKLNEFKGLLLDSVQICDTNNTSNTSNTNDANSSNNNVESTELSENNNTNYHSKNDTNVNSGTPTPSIIYDDTYLPIIDEDKETVYSYNSYNLSTITSSTCDTLSVSTTNTDHLLYFDGDNDNDNDNDDDNDDDSQYLYSDESDDDDDNDGTQLFTKPIYCSTLIYISMCGQQQSYNEIIKLFVNIGGIDKEFIKNVIFKQNYNGFYYALVKIKESVNEMNRIMDNINEYSNDNNLKIVINIFKPHTAYDCDSDYYLNMKQSNKLYVAHFDILNGNIYYDLIKLFSDFGEIKSIEIFENDNNENDPYALVEFKSIRDAVKCFDAHNINMNMSGYCKSLYLAQRLLQIKYAH